MRLFTSSPPGPPAPPLPSTRPPAPPLPPLPPGAGAPRRSLPPAPPLPPLPISRPPLPPLPPAWPASNAAPPLPPLPISPPLPPGAPGPPLPPLPISRPPLPPGCPGRTPLMPSPMSEPPGPIRPSNAPLGLNSARLGSPTAAVAKVVGPPPVAAVEKVVDPSRPDAVRAARAMVGAKKSELDSTPPLVLLPEAEAAPTPPLAGARPNLQRRRARRTGPVSMRPLLTSCLASRRRQCSRRWNSRRTVFVLPLMRGLPG